MRLQRPHPICTPKRAIFVGKVGDECYFTQPVAITGPYIQYPVLWIMYVRLYTYNIKYIALLW